MNYRQAGIYTDRSTIELKTEFEEILEAMEEMGQSKEITTGLLDFWLHGSTLVNYDIYMQKLRADTLLQQQGIPNEHIKGVLHSNQIDKYLLFKNACLNFVGEKLTEDFKTLVIDPIMKIYVEPTIKAKEYRQKRIKEARESIKKVSKNISAVNQELSKIEPHAIAGTFEETIYLKLQQIEHLIVNQLSA